MKLSIIIPVYNQEDLLRRAVESIPENDDIEVLIINDGSTDGTAHTIKELCKEKRVKGFKLSTNQGVANAKNLGLDMARGEYIMVLDSDDYLYADAFNAALEELDGTDIVYYDLESNSGEVWPLVEESKRYYCGATKFIRRKFIGGTRFPRDVRVTEDRSFNEELLKKNPTEKFTHLLVLHYNHPRVGSLCWLKGQEK